MNTRNFVKTMLPNELYQGLFLLLLCFFFEDGCGGMRHAGRAGIETIRRERR